MISRKPRRFQNEFDYPDGSKGHFDLSISPVEEGILILSLDISEALYNHKFKDHHNDQVVGISIASRDITERKFSEESMQKMDKLNSIGTLAGGIAHDFNNILLGISANISMLKMKLPKESNGFEYIDESMLAISRASALTKQLLTFSKGGEPIMEEVNLTTLIKNVVKFDLSGSNVKPKFDFPQNPWLAKVDKGQIQQVISNLAINADQAMPDGGLLTIKIENVEIKESNFPNLDSGNYLKIIVSDTGAGISPDYISQIFDPYFSTKKLGHGLGLATSYSIIIKHKGYITVDSTEGKGTTFTLFLPAILEASSATIKRDDQPANRNLQAGKVLIMDDVEMLRKVMSSILNEQGYQVVAVEDGQKAIDTYASHMEQGIPFDAIIMDLTVPGGKGGVEAIEEILQMDPNAKAIASSGYSNHQAMSDFEYYGFKNIITKPYTNEELLKVLEDVLFIAS